MAADNDSRFYVYVHRRKTDNTIFYVGKGCGYRYKRTDRNPHWQCIVNKHGFLWEVVHKNLTEQQAISFEVDLIAHIGRENLCNMTDGGDGMAGHVKSPSAIEAVRKTHTGRKRSKETCERLSKSQLGKVFSEETRNKISQKLKGQILSEETRRKMSASRTGKKYSKEWRENMSKSWKVSPEAYALRCKAMADASVGRKVVCVETGEVFAKIKLAADWIRSLGKYPKAKGSTMHKAIDKEGYTAYGYRWQYVNE